MCCTLIPALVWQTKERDLFGSISKYTCFTISDGNDLDAGGRQHCLGATIIALDFPPSAPSMRPGQSRVTNVSHYSLVCIHCAGGRRVSTPEMDPVRHSLMEPEHEHELHQSLLDPKYHAGSSGKAFGGASPFRPSFPLFRFPVLGVVSNYSERRAEDCSRSSVKSFNLLESNLELND